jgi:23S rRNA (adenine-N6)-dimethyltransferase
VGARRRVPRASESRSSGQHFLRSAQIANELVQQAAVGPDELVIEIGAGTGRITRPLARRARRVSAVELDGELADRLRRMFRSDPRVEIVQGDILRFPLPDEPFRAFGNVPFGVTTAILRRLLDDPGSMLMRADLLVQYETARKRASVWPSTLASLGWLPWWEFALVRHVPATSFEPPPSVDAGMLAITRRTRPLLPPEERPAYVQLLQLAFRRANVPVGRSLRHVIPRRTWKRIARDRGIRPEASPRDLDAFDWVQLLQLAEQIAATRGT